MNRLHRSLLAFTILLSAFVGNIVLRFGLNEPPSATGDEPSYDSIAWELSHGRGFAEDFENPDFRKPYDEAARTQGTLMVLPESRAGTVTHRPPLFPFVLSTFDRLFGRQFFAARLFNCCLMAMIGAVLFNIVDRKHGLATAILTALIFLVVDSRTRLYSRAVLTESLAALLTMCFTLLLWKLNRSLTLKNAVAAGGLLGLTVLSRSISALWVPGVLLTLILQLRRKAIKPIVGVLLGLIAITGPWAIRNCLVLNSFMPLGAQGMMELPAGFSDEAYRRGGVWFPLDQIGFFENNTDHSESADSAETRLERERRRAEFGRRAAFLWIQQNPALAIKLGAMKIWAEYQPRSSTEGLILIVALAGMIRMAHQPECQTVLGLHFANMLSIALTWSVEGRFVVPMLFGVHYLAAGGIALAIQLIQNAAMRFRPRSGDPSPR